MLPEPGRYRATAGERSVYENQNGTLVFCCDCIIEPGVSILAYQCLTQRDGALNTRTIDNLKAALGWDGTDPFWLMDADLAGKEFEISVEADTDRDGNPTVRVTYIDPVGGGHGRVPEPGNRQALLAKYGSRFRAVSGGTAVRMPQPKPAAAKPPAAPPAPAAPKPAPAPVRPDVAPCSMQQAWQAVAGTPVATMMSQEQLATAWWQLIQDITGKEQGTCTDEDWGLVRAQGPDRLAEIASAA